MHISVGVFVAFWPFYMSLHTIQVISIAFLLVVLLSRRLAVFHAVSKIDRRTWGDILFAISIGLAATLAHNEWVFWAAIMHLGLADGLAAVFGKQFGKGARYHVLGYIKSVAGTATFIITSMVIIAISLHYGHLHRLTLPLLVGLPFGAAFLENFGIFGLDNVFAPLFVIVVLNRL